MRCREVRARAYPDHHTPHASSGDSGHGNKARRMGKNTVSRFLAARNAFEQILPERILRLKLTTRLRNVANRCFTTFGMRETGKSGPVVALGSQHGRTDADGVRRVRLAGGKQRDGQFFVGQK